MSFFTSLGIVIIAMLILAFLQLQPGVFALFCHYAAGKFSKKRASLLTTFFILGTETVAAFLFICALLLANVFYFYTYHPEGSFVTWILAGILVALALISFMGYFRRGSGTKLFIPRKCADSLEFYASKADSPSDAFTLGALSGILELPFTLPLFLVAAIPTTQLSFAFAPAMVLAFLLILAPTLPLFAIRLKFHSGYNLADIIRSRVRDKNFTRFILCLGYAVISILFIIGFFI